MFRWRSTFDPVTSSHFVPSESAPVRIAATAGDPPAIVDREVPKIWRSWRSSRFGSLRADSERFPSLRHRDVSARWKRFNPQLDLLLTLTEERARAQASALMPNCQGPAAGILGRQRLAGGARYPTTWGAGGFQQQVFDDDATIVKRLDEAGAVLIAKLSLVRWRWGQVVGGRTRNP